MMEYLITRTGRPIKKKNMTLNTLEKIQPSIMDKASVDPSPSSKSAGCSGLGSDLGVLSGTDLSGTFPAPFCRVAGGGPIGSVPTQASAVTDFFKAGTAPGPGAGMCELCISGGGASCKCAGCDTATPPVIWSAVAAERRDVQYASLVA